MTEIVRQSVARPRFDSMLMGAFAGLAVGLAGIGILGVLSYQFSRRTHRFVTAMQQLGYGRFESVRIRHGELVLDPWPTFVRSVKFGDATPNRPDNRSGEFELKQQTAQLFEFVRGVEAGEIRVLEVRGGLPFTMEIASNRVL